MYIANGKIQMPMVYVPSWIDAGIQSTIGLAGELNWALVDNNGIRPKVVRRGRQKNMIVKAGFDALKGLPRLGGYAYSYITYYDYIHLVVGKGTAEPTYSDVALINKIGSSPTAAKTPASVWSGEVRPAFMTTQTLVIDENTANDDLTEWGIQFRPYNNKSGQGPITLWCRDLFRDENGVPVVVTKKAGYLLQAQYRLYWDAPVEPNVSVMNIGGSDYECSTLVANRFVKYYGHNFSDGRNDVNIMDDMCFETGTSNEPNSLDDGHNLKGTSLNSRIACALVESYNPETGKTKISCTLLGNQANGAIGEIMLGRYYSRYEKCCRTTITPTFTKSSTQKLVFYYELSSVANAYNIVKIPVMKDEMTVGVAISSLTMTT